MGEGTPMTMLNAPVGAVRMRGGRFVWEMRLAELRRELERLKVPGVTGQMSKDDLIDCLNAHLVVIASQLRQPGAKISVPLQEGVATAALEHLEQQASA